MACAFVVQMFRLPRFLCTDQHPGPAPAEFVVFRDAAKVSMLLLLAAGEK